MATSTHCLGVVPDTEERLRTLFTTYRPAVGNYLARHFDGGVDIDELVDETFVILWRRLDEVPRGCDRERHARRWQSEKLSSVGTGPSQACRNPVTTCDDLHDLGLGVGYSRAESLIQ
jgi:Sigma-70 region 2